MTTETETTQIAGQLPTGPRAKDKEGSMTKTYD